MSMWRRGLLCAVLAAISNVAAGVDVSGTLLVANRDGGSVSLFDLAARVEIARVPIGPKIPHEIAVSPDGRLALTGEYGSNDAPGRHIVVIDIASATVLGRIDLGAESRPHSVAFLPDGRRAVATMERADRIALLDVVDRRVLRTFPTGGREGHMVRSSPDGTRAYVTSRGAEGTLSVIALDADVAPVVIPTGQGAEGLAVTPDGREVWVVNRGAASISIVDAASLRVVETIAARPNAGRVEISRDGRVLVPNGASAQATAQYLTVYDARTRAVVDELAVRESGRGAFGIHLFGEVAFVSDRGERSIRLYDLAASLAEAETLTTEHDDPDGLAYSPVRVQVYDQDD